MDNIIQYSLKVSLSITIFYGFYPLFLSNNTFFRINRYFLLFTVPVSMFCPFLHSIYSFGHPLIHNNFIFSEFSDLTITSNNLMQTGVRSTVGLGNLIILIFYIAGAFIFLFHFILQLFRLSRQIRSSVILERGEFTLLQTDKYNTPFSFFNWVLVPQGFESLEGSHLILEHEKVHMKEIHTFDILAMEIFCILFWFNPVVFMIKRSLKSIHEFSADHEVIKNKSSVSEYLSLLVTGTEMSCLTGITNHFKNLIIKKRITMITKTKTPSYWKYLYLLTLPLIAFIVLAMSPLKSENNPPSLRPVKNGEITSGFGLLRQSPFDKNKTRHTGIDIKAPIGTDVIAPAGGVVIRARKEGDYGNVVLIKHDDHYQTFYAHLEDLSVKTGNHVTQGQVIGHVGNTGLSTGPHLHYEVIKDGKRVNPEAYFSKQDN